MGAADVCLINSAGRPVDVRELRYNAAISAIELRAPRYEGAHPALLQEIGTSPIRIQEGVSVDGKIQWLDRALLHYEIATLVCPFEFNVTGRHDCATEVVILRGVRFEVIE